MTSLLPEHYPAWPGWIVLSIRIGNINTGIDTGEVCFIWCLCLLLWWSHSCWVLLFLASFVFPVEFIWVGYFIFILSTYTFLLCAQNWVSPGVAVTHSLILVICLIELWLVPYTIRLTFRFCFLFCLFFRPSNSLKSYLNNPNRALAVGNTTVDVIL